MTKDFEKELMLHYPKLINWALRHTRHRQNAEDLVADTVERAMKCSEQYQLGTNMSGWLSVIMRNIRVSTARRKVLVKYDNDAGLDTPAHTPSPDVSVVARDIARSLKTLSPFQLEVVKQVLVEGCRYEEAADNLGRSMSSIKSSLNKGREKMRRSIEGISSCPT